MEMYSKREGEREMPPPSLTMVGSQGDSVEAHFCRWVEILNATDRHTDIQRLKERWSKTVSEGEEENAAKWCEHESST